MKIPKKHQAVAHAFVDGADVEHRAPEGHRDRDWHPDPLPFWHEDWEYRVAPKKKVKKWRWVVEMSGGCLFVTDGLYADQADYAQRTQYEDILIQRIDDTAQEVEE